MTIENLPLFQAIGAKMDFLNQRQRVVAQNISNADTPNYRPKDVVNADFSRVLKSVTGGSDGVRIETTKNNHHKN